MSSSALAACSLPQLNSGILYLALDINGKKSLDPFEMNYTPVIAAALGQH